MRNFAQDPAIEKENEVRGLLARWRAWTESFVPEEAKLDPEKLRISHLLIGFGFIGPVFGVLYALFYYQIGHSTAATIIVFCSLCFASMPLFLKKSGDPRFSGDLFSAVLIVGFTALAGLEGGARGHAVAWLATVPLCALLLTRFQRALFWSILTMLVVLGFSVMEMTGRHLPYDYPEELHGIITSVGFAGLTVFLFSVGLIYERTRKNAMAAKQEALDALQEAHDELVRLNQEKDEFLGIAAHDLKNPLTAVQAYAGLIEQSAGPQAAETKEMAERIGEAAERMSSIVGNVLDVNAIEQGKFPIRAGRYDLADLVQKCLRSYEHAAESKKIAFHRELETVPAWVDQEASGQVIDNLVSNALKYSPSGRRVWISTREEDSRALLQVRDEGPGMSPEDRAKLFQRFMKLTARPTGGESSTGLGLSIVKKIVEAMDGQIGCESELGQGCIFWVKLPLAKSREAASGF
ncbi:MAG: HAMP domain-containing sensor histidine kinase [Verrucomicrobiota bacterium]